MVTSYTLCAAVENIIRSMSHRHRDRGCGTYLFVTREGCVYLLLEDQSSAQRWLKDHFEELVGFYTQLPTRDFGLSIEANSMAEDIRDHMRGFGAWQ